MDFTTNHTNNDTGDGAVEIDSDTEEGLVIEERDSSEPDGSEETGAAVVEGMEEEHSRMLNTVFTNVSHAHINANTINSIGEC